ncbi:MAG: aminopeptidase P family N-terminal domain-containing protein [Proteocatella sp.]
MSSVTERVIQLQKMMKEKGIDIYVVPTADFHQSEYVGEHFKARKFITGFTGSAGTAVITQTEAGLWTDGRYFIQAAEQIEGSPVCLFKMGEPGVLDIPEYLAQKLPEGGTLAFDGRVVSMGEGVEYEAIVSEKQGKIHYEEDLIDQIWTDRPVLSEEKAFALEEKYTGESVASKLERIRKEMKKYHATSHVITTIDDICWTLNIRGNDIEFFPLVLSYAIITMDKMHVYINENKLSAEMKENLQKDGIVFHAYNDIYEDIKKIDANEKLLVDPAKINYSIYSNIPASVKKIEGRNPAILFKAMKNETEIENIRKAEIKDSICHIKFMKWVKENYDKMEITELSASKKLDELRETQENYIRPSFAPICAYGEHSALCHYESSPETDVQLKEGNFFLTDTGAGFMEGSTDITRTYALGEVSKERKEHFTLVAISNLQLANAKFLYGSTGMVLDILARKPFWDRNLNFNHGTGHGIGYLLNIHEGPTGFRWKHRAGEVHPLEAGMVLTDEPGIYIEGSHGVRLENELLVCKGQENEYGQFMYMETITYIPFDLDAIVPEIMTAEDKKLLNEYHAMVYDRMAPYLEADEKEWLKKYTRAI